MEITFHGAVRTVTGSQHLLSLNNSRVLLDCGLYQGPRKESYFRNQHFLFDPETLAAVVLSHAHIDHSGNLPNLMKKGFRGEIHATPPTRDLARFMLLDSGKIQESDAAFVNKRHAKRGEPPIEPLYTAADAEAALEHLVAHRYGDPFHPVSGITATFYEAGHILGSAVVVLEVDDHGRQLRLAFSGDLGRKKIPLLRDPQVVENIDYLILESTYGNRLHAPPDEAYAKLRQVVGEACERGGKIIIPSFAVGRAQDLIYNLHRLMDQGAVPRIPVYVDSPLATNIARVFRGHKEVYDTQARLFIQNDSHPDAFVFPELTYVSSVEESKALNDKPGPMVVISASGMCETGRVLHHLRNNIENPSTTVLIVSWQAPHTLGRRLVEKQPRVRIFGEEFKVRARVEVINGFSAHADREGLLEYAAALRPKLKGVFLVHGELTPALALAEGLRDIGLRNVVVPELHQTVEL